MYTEYPSSLNSDQKFLTTSLNVSLNDKEADGPNQGFGHYDLLL